MTKVNEYFKTEKKQTKGLFLYGPNGTGKTTAMQPHLKSKWAGSSIDINMLVQHWAYLAGSVQTGAADSAVFEQQEALTMTPHAAAAIAINLIIFIGLFILLLITLDKN